VFSVDTEEEAQALIVLTCPLDRVTGEYYSPELHAQRVLRPDRGSGVKQVDEDLDVLNAFSDRLAKAYELMKSKQAERTTEVKRRVRRRVRS
jgi:hypothetical protein